MPIALYKTLCEANVSEPLSREAAGSVPAELTKLATRADFAELRGKMNLLIALPITAISAGGSAAAIAAALIKYL